MNIAQISVPLVLLIVYLFLFAWMLFKRRVRTRGERLLVLYLLVSALWHVLITIRCAVSPASVWFVVIERVALAGQVLLSVVFLLLIYEFLRQTSRFAMSWLVLSVLYVVGVVLLTPELVPLNLGDVMIASWQIGPETVVQVLSILAWGLFTFATIATIWRVYRQTTSPMHRNRYRYLLLSLLVLVVGDAFFVSGQAPFKLFGIGARLCSTLVLVLVALRHSLLDIKTLYRHTLSYLAVTLITIFVGCVSVIVTIELFGVKDMLSGALISTGVVSLLLSFANVPIHRAVQRAVNRRLFHIDADYDAALRVYGEKVIETLRLELLADLVVDTLVHTTGIDTGGLYLVREGQREIGGVLLDPINLVGPVEPEPFELGADSVLAVRLQESDAPIAQFDIDLRAEFAGIPERERAWLHALRVELLMPIHTSEKLVGVIVLGAKGSGEVYTLDEISWLKALAAQTAVALQNARLFDQVESMSIDMMRLNADLELAYQRLQEVDQLKSDFIGVITHELRSPFVSAGFSVQLLERYVERKMYDELHSQIQQLNNELADGRKMIDKIISFASLLSKQGQLELEETDMEALIHEAVAPLEKLAQSRDVAVSFHLSSKLPAINVDRERMGEAIYHMVHNAIKFNREGGNVRIACWPKESMLVFKVDDSGRGIPEEKLATIWDAFTQGADGVKRGVEGLGLGLPLIKFVVEAHNGQVWASSDEGHGCTFGFRIPIKAAPEPVTAPPPTAEIAQE